MGLNFSYTGVQLLWAEFYNHRCHFVASARGKFLNMENKDQDRLEGTTYDFKNFAPD